MVFTSCTDAATGAAGSVGKDGVGTPGDTILSGNVSEAAVRYALASGKPVVFAGATVTKDGTASGGPIRSALVIDRPVTLIANSPALTVEGTVIITAEPVATNNATISAGILIGDEKITSKYGTPGAGTPIEPTATGEVNYADIDSPPATVVVIGNLTIDDDDTVSVTDLYVTGTLLVEGDLTVSGAGFVGGLVTVAKDAGVTCTTEPPTGTLLLKEGAAFTVNEHKIVGDGDAVYTVGEDAELQVAQVGDGGTAYTVKKGTVTINKDELYNEHDVLIVDKGATISTVHGLTVKGTVDVAGTLSITDTATGSVEGTITAKSGSTIVYTPSTPFEFGAESGSLVLEAGANATIGVVTVTNDDSATGFKLTSGSITWKKDAIEFAGAVTQKVSELPTTDTVTIKSGVYTIPASTTLRLQQKHLIVDGGSIVGAADTSKIQFDTAATYVKTAAGGNVSNFPDASNNTKRNYKWDTTTSKWVVDSGA
jgi:hypothetical protein